MLVIAEKSSMIQKVKNALGDKIGSDDEFIYIFGKDGVDIDIPDGLHNSASDLDTLIKHDLLDQAISFETMNYLMARSILGANGESFRNRTKDLYESHDKIVFFVDPDFMTTVAHKLIKEFGGNTDDREWFVVSTLSFQVDAVRSAFDSVFECAQ